MCVHVSELHRFDLIWLDWIRFDSIWLIPIVTADLSEDLRWNSRRLICVALQPKRIQFNFVCVAYFKSDLLSVRIKYPHSTQSYRREFIQITISNRCPNKAANGKLENISVTKGERTKAPASALAAEAVAVWQCQQKKIYRFYPNIHTDLIQL